MLLKEQLGKDAEKETQCAEMFGTWKCTKQPLAVHVTQQGFRRSHSTEHGTWKNQRSRPAPKDTSRTSMISMATSNMSCQMGLTRGPQESRCVLAHRLLMAQRLEAQQGLAPVRNAVFMGMGEPLNNYAAWRKRREV